MTASPVQGAGTDDELREAMATALCAQEGATVDDLTPDSRRALYADLDALLSDPGVLAAMRRREQQAAVEAWEAGFDAAHDWWCRAMEGWPPPNPHHAASLDPNGRPDQ